MLHFKLFDIQFNDPMGSVFSIIGVLAVGTYVFDVVARHGKERNSGNIVVHAQTDAGSITTLSDEGECGAGDKTTSEGRRAAISMSVFQQARNVNASHSIISKVDGDQHVNITNMADTGTTITIMSFSLTHAQKIQSIGL